MSALIATKRIVSDYTIPSHICEKGVVYPEPHNRMVSPWRLGPTGSVATYCFAVRFRGFKASIGKL